MITQELKQAFAKSGTHLGDLVWWSLDDARVNRQTLEQLWRARSLDPALLPEAPTPEKAFREACKEAAVGLKKNGRELRLAFENANQVVFELESFWWDGNKTEHSQEATVSLDLTLSSPLPKVGGTACDVTQDVEARYQTLLTTHTTGDVGKMLVKTLKSIKAFTLRPSGGVYFVPDASAQEIRNVRDVVQALGQSFMDVVPVHDGGTGEARESMAKAAQKSLEKDLADLVTELRTFVAKPPRGDTLERRLEEFRQLREKAEFYRTLLSCQVDGLEKGLEDMTEIVQKMLAQDDEPAAAANG